LLTSRTFRRARCQPLHVTNFFSIKPGNEPAECNNRAPHDLRKPAAALEREVDLKLSANFTKTHVGTRERRYGASKPREQYKKRSRHRNRSARGQCENGKDEGGIKTHHDS